MQEYYLQTHIFYILFYEIKNKYVYEQCFKDKDLFDFSGYPKDSVY